MYTVGDYFYDVIDMALLCVAIAGASVGVTVGVCLCFGRMAGLQEYGEQSTRVPDCRTKSGLWVAEGEEPDRRTHPLYKKLSAMNGAVNGMSRGQLKRRLRELNMEPGYVVVATHTMQQYTFCCRGEDSILSKRLKNHLRREAISQEPDPPWELHNSIQTNPYGLDYLLILDFEATCQQVNPPDFIHEIIEFPVLMFSLKTLTVVRLYHQYI